uniref:CSON004169 protein n=1 Tax=Culicoides sonorensis TaxID=179676 RepID=A0A336MQP3_CULSO
MTETETNNLSSNLIVSGIKASVVPSKTEQKNGNATVQVSSDETAKDFEPPDGTWRGWIIMLSAFLCNGVIFGIINTYSVIYLKIQKQLEESGDTEASSKAALVGSLTIGSTFFLSPVSGILVDKIGIRKTTVLGGILCAGGMFFSSYCATNVIALYFTYGVCFGSGAALAYTPSLAILGHYFKKYLGIANGIVTAGSSVFTVALPILLNYLIENTGLSTTFQLLSIITGLMIVSGILFKPLAPPAPKPMKKETRSAAHNLARSLINFDNWKKRKYVIWAVSIPMALFGYFVPYVHISKFVTVNFPEENSSYPVMCIGFASFFGRLLFGMVADLPRINRILLQQLAFVMIGLMTLLLPLTESFLLLCIFSLGMGLFDGCFISLLGPIAYDICGSAGATQAIGFLLGLCSVPLTIGPPIAGLIYDHTGSYTLPFVLAGIPPIIGALCMCSIHFVKEGPRKEAVGDTDPKHITQNGFVDAETRSAAHNLARSLINFDNWKKRKYVIWAVSIPMALFGYFVPYVHISKFVTVNFPEENSSYPVMCIGFASFFGRLLFGMVADLPRINRILLQQLAFVMIGLMTLLLPLTESFLLLCIFSLGMGLFDGCFISLLGPIAYDICGSAGATQAIGFLLGLCSVPLTIGPPIAGLIYDHTGSYTLPFVLAGVPPIIGALCMCSIHFVKEGPRKEAVGDTDPKHITQNGFVDAENASETKTFLDKPLITTNPSTKPITTTKEKAKFLASSESLNDVIDENPKMC